MDRGESMVRGKVRVAAGSAQGATATGRALALLPTSWRAIHDVRWPGRQLANIDHVVIGPGGVFVIHARTWTGEVEVRHDQLMRNGRKQESSVLAVEACAIAVAGSADGVDPALVQPVLCLVREEVVEGKVGEVLVCSITNLASVLSQRAPVIDEAEVEAIHSRLRADLPVAAAHRADRSRGKSRGRRAGGRRSRAADHPSADELVRGVRRKHAWRRRAKGVVTVLAALVFVLGVGALVGAVQTNGLRTSFETFMDKHVTPTVVVGEAAEIEGSDTRPRMSIVAGAPRPVTPRPGTGKVAGGNQLWGVLFRVENLSTGVGLMPPWLSSAHVRDGSRDYTVSGHAIRQGRPLPTNQPLAPGQTLTGYLVFELPHASTIERVRMTIRGETARWKVIAGDG
jgi:hypothetical protein